jgi:AAA15 family ATPase/GTPase
MNEQHLKHLYIQNFRPFEDLHIEKLKQINVTTGRNNVGKTALLEAVMIAAAFRNYSSLYNVLEAILSRRDNMGYMDNNTMYLSLFTQKNVPTISINELTIKSELKIRS